MEDNYKKKYEELVKHIKHFHQSVNPEWKRTIESYVPEIKEIEDENIKEEIISFLKEGNPYHCPNSVRRQEWATWLEKQGEQKPTDKIELKFKVGDWVVTNNGEPKKVFRVEKQEWPDCIISGSFGNEFINTFTLDKQFHLWTIQDAKDGDVLCDYHEEYDNPLIFILKKFEHVNFGLAKPSDYSSYCFLTAGDKQRFKEGKYHHKHNIKPATKEQCDLLFQKMKEAGYEWNAEKKELKKIEQKSETNDDVLSRFAFYQYDDDTIYLSSLFVRESDRRCGYGSKALKAAEEVARVFGISKIRLKVERNTWMEEWYEKNGYEYLSSEGKYDWLENRVIDIKSDKIEQKPTWSEEDEEMFDAIIADIQFTQKAHIHDVNQVVYEREIDWLKSFKERYTWKPSDEQIEALLKLEEMHVLEHEKNQENAHLYMVVKSIREQLLKLKEE